MTKTLKFSLLVALAMVLVAIPACGGGAAPTPTTKPAAPAPTSPPAATKPAAPAATTAPAATKPAAPAPTTAAPPATKGDTAAGKAVFEQNCNGCHPGGSQGVGPALKGRNVPADRIRTQVRNGGGGMPPFPSSRISDQQLNDLVAYVQSL